jgi:hypothetical protein
MTKKQQDPSNTLVIDAKDKQDEKKQMAALSIDSALNAAATSKVTCKAVEVDVTDVFKAITATSKEACLH